MYKVEFLINWDIKILKFTLIIRKLILIIRKNKKWTRNFYKWYKKINFGISILRRIT